MPILFRHMLIDSGKDQLDEFADQIEGSLTLTSELINDVVRLVRNLPGSYWRMGELISSVRPFASAPIRSQPRRTYDPTRMTPKADGDSVAMRFAWLSMHDEDAWEKLKQRLDEFGRTAGLFDEILLRRLARRHRIHSRSKYGNLMIPMTSKHSRSISWMSATG